MGLREGQKAFVENYKGGLCAVPAIPGAGKTYCLSVWAASIIAKGLHKPGKILVVTYMNSAVSNFKQRIFSELQSRGISSSRDYEVSTIHKLCLRIIKEKPDIISANQEFEIIDDVYRTKLVNFALNEWKKNHQHEFMNCVEQANLNSDKLASTYANWHEQLCRTVQSTISSLKHMGIDARIARSKCEKLDPSSLLRYILQIYQTYDKYLKIGGYIDFDDILCSAKLILQKDKHLLKEYQDRYSFVCEDEAQDSNLVQNDILTMISNQNLLRVGDSNQAICGSFSSSDFRLFKDFCKNSCVNVYTLTQSSRSSKNIIDVANFFVRFVVNNHPVPLCRNGLLMQYIQPVDHTDSNPNPITEEYGITAECVKSYKDEINTVVQRLQQVFKNHPDKTVAILSPSAWKIKMILQKLDDANIPYEYLDNTSEEKNKTVKILGRIMDFISLPESGEKLADMVVDCLIDKNNYSNVHSFKSFISSFPTQDILYPIAGEIDYNSIPSELKESEIWDDFISKLNIIREFLEFPQSVIEKFILYISEKLHFCLEERAIAQKVASDIRYLMKQNPKWQLSHLASELLKSKNIFNFFAGIVWDLKGYIPKPGVVTVSTYHKAKGLEWDVVFLTAVTRDDFPCYLSDRFMGECKFLKNKYRNPSLAVKNELAFIAGKDMAQNTDQDSKIEIICEKARLLYVGITRAKRYLHISGHELMFRDNALSQGYLQILKSYIEQEGSRAK